MYKTRIAASETEEKMAYELFCKEFGPPYKCFFDSNRESDISMKNGNLFIAVNNREEIVAALQAVTRELRILGHKFSVGGIALTAVHSEHRGKDLFSSLTSFALQEMISRGMSLCLVFARRRIDHVYVPHGFWGTPVERKYEFISKDLPEKSTRSLSYRKVEIADIGFLERTYRQSYGNLSVFLDRPAFLWETKLRNPASPGRFDGYICFDKETAQPIGYIFGKREMGIIEIASNSEEPITYVDILFSPNSPLLDASKAGLSLSTEHPAIKAFRGYSYSIYTRHPNYGGNVLKILDPYNRKSKIMQLLESQLADKDIKVNKDISNILDYVYSRVLTAALFGYEVPETRSVMKIGENSKWDVLKPVDFIFSSLDDF